MYNRVTCHLAAGLPLQVSIVGAKALVQKGSKTADAPSTTSMIGHVLHGALKEAQLDIQDVDGLIAVPSLKENHFMESHYQATLLGMFSPDRPLRCRTIDTGGAGPVSALLEAERMIKNEMLDCVAVVAADSVGSMSSHDFLDKADNIFLKLAAMSQPPQKVKSPAIPHGYDKITQYQMKEFGLKRDQLRMAVCLESFHAGMHKKSLYYQKNHPKGRRYTPLQDVRQAPNITPNISILECARRADGAACLILASNRFLVRRNLYQQGLPSIIGGGESSGPLYPLSDIDEASYSSCEEAMTGAYASAGNLSAKDIDFFGLYDCFPICLVRALEACGLTEKGRGGEYLEQQYTELMQAMEADRIDTLLANKTFFPVNTHGGLLCYGAPWEVPAMYNIIEAVHQLRGTTQGRQIDDCRRALVYGNGGVLSASAVAILARSSL
jgi:acetyl-CoA acetyltransferase